MAKVKGPKTFKPRQQYMMPFTLSKVTSMAMKMAPCRIPRRTLNSSSMPNSSWTFINVLYPSAWEQPRCSKYPNKNMVSRTPAIQTSLSCSCSHNISHIFSKNSLVSVNSDRIRWLWSCQKDASSPRKHLNCSTLSFLLQLDLRLEAFALCKAKMAVHVSIWGTTTKFMSMPSLRLEPNPAWQRIGSAMTFCQHAF